MSAFPLTLVLAVYLVILHASTTSCSDNDGQLTLVAGEESHDVVDNGQPAPSSESDHVSCDSAQTNCAANERIVPHVISSSESFLESAPEPFIATRKFLCDA